MRRPERLAVLILLLVFVTVLVASCGGAGSLTSFSETLTPMSAEVEGTITARAASENNNDILANAISTATSEANIIYGTQTAAANLNSPERLATATAIAPVLSELPFFGIDPSEGYVAWLHSPAKIDLTGPNQIGTANDYPNITGSNFAMSATITWHTVVSTSGCGFFFRSNGDKNHPSQYMVVISRLASGQLAFLGMSDGKLSNYHSFFPRSIDKSFTWENDKSNRLGIVARGNLIDLYTNDVKIATVDTTQPPDTALNIPSQPELPAGATDAQKQDFANLQGQSLGGMDFLNSQLAQARQNYIANKGGVFTDGFLGFLGINQSGTMSCTFDNGWLFQLVK